MTLNRRPERHYIRSVLERLSALLQGMHDVGFWLGLRAQRTLMPLFTSLGGHDGVALIDGFSILVHTLLIHDKAGATIDKARRELGDSRYEEIKAMAAGFDNAHFLAELTA